MEKSLWSNKRYITLQAAQFVSGLGDWLHVLAMFTLVSLTFEATPIELSGLVLSQAVPGIVFGPLAGVIVDRWNRKYVMIATALLRAGAVGMLFAASFIWQIYFIFFAIGSLAAIFAPAENGLVKQLVPDNQMPTAIAVSEVLGTISKIAGPVFGGTLLLMMEVKYILLVDIGTFLFAAVLLSTIKVARLQTEREELDLIGEMKDGIRIIRQSHHLYAALLLISAAMLVLQFADSQVMVLLRLVLEQPTTVFGYSIAASGAGMFLAAYLFGSKRLRMALAPALIFGTLGIGTVVLLLGGASYLPEAIYVFLVPLLFFAIGFGFSSINMPFHTAVQLQAKVTETGKVYGTINSFMGAGAVLGMAAGGIIMTVFGPILGFILTGCLLLTLGMTAWFSFRKIKGGEALAKSDGRIQREEKARSAENG
ncbi:MFS transporter [Terribacillus goriensis]|uniref:MFS transporter n=1 Tax=Terribacillus saccharophilus TaxID=361277 RepID=UPI0039831480